MIGKTLLHYEVTARIGAGGMGEVYRATDTKLGREVAVKVLPAEVAQNEERLARFRREARVLAALNHPGIASIYGLEEADGQPFLVMELAPGEDLQQRLERGPIPVDEATLIAKQIAEALREAHERGIVHRDLKPANTKLGPEGEVKILDFGLARAWGGGGESADSDLSSSPTEAFTGTSAGVILGTAAYMSPEQASGKPVDKRSDIWSFGVVFFEMLTGQRLFAGETASEVLASVIKDEPGWHRLPKACPPSTLMLLRHCLRKKPRERLQDAGDIRLLLAEREDDGGAGSPPARSQLATALPWLGTAAITLAGALLLLRPPMREASHDPPLQRLTLELPRSAPNFIPALSPDGRYLSYSSVSNAGDWQLFLRPLDESDPRPVEGTSKGEYQFFSSDSDWLAFHAQGELRKVPISGGSPIVICQTPELIGGAWSPRGEVVFGQPNDGLYRVSATGGEPMRLTDPAADGAIAHTWPHFLPGGDSLLYTIWSGSDDDAQIGWLSLSDGSSRVVATGAGAQFAPSGHLVFRRGTSLMAQRFDPTSGTVDGEALEMVRPVGGFFGGASFALSPRGQLFHYSSPQAVLETSMLVVVDREGVATPLWADAGTGWNQPRISPSGRRLAYFDSSTGSIRSVVLESGRSIPVFRGDAGQLSAWPVWSPDGKWVAFVSVLAGGFNTFRARADGDGEAEQLTFEPTRTIPSSWSVDDVLAIEQGTNNARSIFMLRMEEGEDRELEPFLVTRFNERGARFSPDGEWVAFTSDRSGLDEVWVVAYPDAGVPIPISIGGGRDPAWSRDGRELFYRRGDEMWRVPIESDAGLPRPGQPEVLFQGRFAYGYIDWASNYDVAPDGRFFMVKEEPPPPLNVVVGWQSELQRRLPRN